MENCGSMEIRELFEDDFPVMKEFFRDVFTREPWCDDWSDDAQLSAYIRDIAGCFNSISFGFFENGEMVALCIGKKHHWWGGTEYFIEELCVRFDLQGKGVGTRFMAEIEREILKRGMFQIYLQTERGKPAAEFYKKVGFDEIENTVCFFKQVKK